MKGTLSELFSFSLQVHHLRIKLFLAAWKSLKGLAPVISALWSLFSCIINMIWSVYGDVARAMNELYLSCSSGTSTSHVGWVWSIMQNIGDPLLRRLSLIQRLPTHKLTILWDQFIIIWIILSVCVRLAQWLWKTSVSSSTFGLCIGCTFSALDQLLLPTSHPTVWSKWMNDLIIADLTLFLSLKTFTGSFSTHNFIFMSNTLESFPKPKVFFL